MQIKKYFRNDFITAAMSVMLCLTVSCKKFVEVDIPATLLYSENVFNSSSTATAALTSIYSQMQNGPISYQLPYYTGLSGDELINYSSALSNIQLYQNNLSPTNNLVQTLWSNEYKFIYQANAVMESLDRSSGISEAIKKQLTGEARFIRAICHFDLINMFGNVPLILSSDYTANALVPAATQADVIKQVIADLTEAQNLLNTNYVGTDNLSVTTERVRPNKAAAVALLARVYLYKGDYAGAEAKATDIINDKSRYDTVSLDKVFLANSKEAVWQMQAVSTVYTTPEGYNFILTSTPVTAASQQSSSLSNQLLNSFEAGDQRKIKWTGSVIASGNTYYFPNKYKLRILTTQEYSTVLRIGELYLIRAEARAMTSNFSGAQDDLNLIRKRAGLPNITAATQSTLVDAILHERQTELFTEWGHRWFDLKRTGRLTSVMNTVAPLKSGNWNAYKQLFPIPQVDRNNDPNLEQNPGY